ncbi:type II toxin-antitoxin system VapC family toxin [Zhaonella formicivorans]|uniref:type II toxin-antitoxin system VapC family toxin n=1 Tax=Zhaonella formicivorans TaxID=2528593 RepID=UPI001D1191E9|nr:PIN domain-containing protein [Zhaonella formicivorans]
MNNEAVFVDTGAFYALIDRDDPYHVVAYKQWSELLNEKRPIIITNYIVSETYTLLRYRLGATPSQKFLQVLEDSSNSGRIEVKLVNSDVEKSARELLINFKEYDLSYTDAVSFALIRHYRIPQAFSFDRHFNLAEVAILPEIGSGTTGNN